MRPWDAIACAPAETWDTWVAVRPLPSTEDKSCHPSGPKLPDPQGTVWK